MKRFFSYAYDEDGFQRWDTAEEAEAAAKTARDAYRDDASGDGWPENIEQLVMWGEVKEAPVIGKRETKAEYEADGEEWPYDNAWDEIYDVQLDAPK